MLQYALGRISTRNQAYGGWFQEDRPRVAKLELVANVEEHSEILVISIIYQNLPDDVPLIGFAHHSLCVELVRAKLVQLDSVVDRR